MFSRRLPFGAEIQARGGVHFRVWAPAATAVSVVLEDGPGEGKEAPLSSEGGGMFAAFVPTADSLTTYRYRLNGKLDLYPDPASRFQPRGPHGPSQVIDALNYPWTDEKWSGCTLDGQIIYEMHIGTFTREGTWAAAAQELPRLAELGVTVLEVMPIADFAGTFGWGYDGVNMYAPTRLYGAPDDLRRFVDRAHELQLGVILDVVYNHLGPDGNFLSEFAPDYFTDRYQTDWGRAINFDGENAQPVREFFIANAGYWIEEFHLDGLRLDATQSIFDTSPVHILAAIGQRVREAAQGRATLIVSENESQQTKLVRSTEHGGYGLDMLWNDDYHHTCMTALTGHNEAYYTDYLGTPQEFISAAKWGFLYQGQRYKWQKQRRGTPTFGLNSSTFVNFLQNHDQIANSARGHRCHALASPGRFRALTALTLLMPGTPMLFQGQEFAASNPFLFFADHGPQLAPLVRDGRIEFLSQFPTLALPEMQVEVADPGALETFERCKLDSSEQDRHANVVALHRDLITLRRNDPVLRAPGRGEYDGAILGAESFALRYFGGGHGDRLLIVNLGRDLPLDPAPEPLLAPPAETCWQPLWSSEDPRYGGSGSPPPDPEERWLLLGQAAILLGAG